MASLGTITIPHMMATELSTASAVTISSDGTTDCGDEDDRGELTLSEQDCRQWNMSSEFEDDRVFAFVLQVHKLLRDPGPRVGPHTFFPKQKSYYEFSPANEARESPILWAAKQGRLHDLKLLLYCFGSVIDLNVTGTCSFATTGHSAARYDSFEVVHRCSALYVACRSAKGSKALVKLLVAHGADVNLPTCRQMTPLIEAASNGKLDVVQYLVKHGASINSASLVGSGKTALIAAASRGRCKVVAYLMKHGADVEIRNCCGETAIHLAAREGHTKAVKLLLPHCKTSTLESVPPPPATPSPLPLMLAASEGHQETVNFLFRKWPTCPLWIQSDVYLLLGASEFSNSLERAGSQLLTLWEKALSLRAASPVQPQYLPPRECYGGRVEIRTCKDLDRIKDSPVELLYQGLLIRERIFGVGHRNTVNGLIFSIRTFMRLVRGMELQDVWKRTLEAILALTEQTSRAIRDHVFLHGFYSRWLKTIDFSLQYHKYLSGHPPSSVLDFKSVAAFTVKGLDYLNAPCPDPECIKPDNSQLALAALKIFSGWLYQGNPSTSATTFDPENMVIADKDCNELGRKLVSKYLHVSTSYTLLHFALWEENVRQFKSVSLLVSALLHWGADAVANEVDSQGDRPLHLAVRHADADAVQQLVWSGAHLDAVDADGQTPAQLFSKRTDSDQFTISLKPLFHATVPPLQCLCSTCVVVEGLPYQELGLPRHIKEFLQLHDKSHL